MGEEVAAKHLPSPLKVIIYIFISIFFNSNNIFQNVETIPLSSGDVKSSRGTER